MTMEMEAMAPDTGWSKLSDEEIDRAISEAKAAGADARGALQQLATGLVEMLLNQDRSAEEFLDYSKATYKRLTEVSECIGDDVIPHIIPFVNSNIDNDNWKYKAAAIMAFGSILGGLQENTLKAVMDKNMPALIEAVFDTSVGHIAARTFGRICEIVPEDIANETYLTPILQSVVDGLKTDHRVAVNVLEAFVAAVQNIYTENINTYIGECKTYCMISAHFDVIIERLLETIDTEENHLRSAAYSALMVMVHNAPPFRHVTVQKTTMVLLDRLHDIISCSNSSNNLQSYLCEVLVSVTKEMSKVAAQISDDIMKGLLIILAHNARKDALLSNAALTAVAAVAKVLGEGFVKHMDGFKDYLYMGLKDHENCNVFQRQTIVLLTVDICWALKCKALPYCDDITRLMFDIIRAHGPAENEPVLMVFGEMALGIGPDFAKYFNDVMAILLQFQAGSAEVVSVLEAYTCIIIGIKARPDAKLMVEPHLLSMLDLIAAAASVAHPDPDTFDASTDLIDELLRLFTGWRERLRLFIGWHERLRLLIGWREMLRLFIGWREMLRMMTRILFKTSGPPRTDACLSC